MTLTDFVWIALLTTVLLYYACAALIGEYFRHKRDLIDYCNNAMKGHDV